MSLLYNYKKYLCWFAELNKGPATISFFRSKFGVFKESNGTFTNHYFSKNAMTTPRKTTRGIKRIKNSK